MTWVSSLRSRIFLTSAWLAVLSIAVAIYLVNQRVTSETEAALQRDILSTGALVDQLRTTRGQMFTTLARFIADTSLLKAAVDTNDPQTVQQAVKDYPQQLNSSLLIVTNKAGDLLATVGTSRSGALIVASQPAVRDALAGHESVGLLPEPNGVLQLVTVPIALYRTDPEILGTLSVGFLLDDALAAQLKSITGSDMAFAMDGQVLAATLGGADRAALSALLRGATLPRSVRIGGVDYVALPRPLAPNADGPTRSRPVVLILRSRGPQTLLLHTIRNYLAGTAVVAVLLATLLSYAVARTITRPLAAITDVMRDMAATGDLTRKIALRHASRWDDEDARLLATTFNTLTDSIARFQREMSQRERLSALGRLSTVIAHEVRNPLMIIKAALHALRQHDVSAATMHEAIADIDEEVVRLNRIVNEVLDFARPIRFELAPADLNALCRESAAAAQAAAPGPTVHLDLDGTLPAVTTDAERLRIALVNMLVNARHAVEARPPESVAAGAARLALDRGPVPSGTPPPPVSLSTRAAGDRAIVLIADRGAGIDPADLPRVFDPYFTTKRGGTGLGLAIARNIVDGLGGAIGVTSTPGRGTEIRIDLPITAGAE